VLSAIGWFWIADFGLPILKGAASSFHFLLFTSRLGEGLPCVAFASGDDVSEDFVGEVVDGGKGVRFG
jgi:hypothetical protein